MTARAPHFDGSHYDPKHDHERLTRQIDRVREAMADSQWRTLDEIAQLTGDPHASISAQLRHLRKRRFGSWMVRVRPRKDRDRGLYEYRLIASGLIAPEPKNRRRTRRYINALEEVARVARDTVAAAPLLNQPLAEVLRAMEATR